MKSIISVARCYFGAALFTLAAYIVMQILSCSALPHKGHERGELLIGYKAGTTLTQQDSLLTHYRLALLLRLSHLMVDHVRIGQGEKEKILIDSLGACPLVEYVELNLRGTVESTPSDPEYGSQWHLTRIGAPAAWDSTQGDSAIVVAVIDAGIDTNHTDLRANLWLNADEVCNDGIDNDANGFRDDCRGWSFSGGFLGSADVYDATSGGAAGHGTHVAGLVAAVTNNGVGGAGIGYRTTIMPIKVFSANSTGGTVTMVAKAISYAVGEGAKVINISIQLAGLSTTVERAIAEANLRGVLVVCATGNSGKSLDLSPVYPACHKHANIIAVGASEANDAWAKFANYSATQADLAAPGRNILSTKRGGGYEARTGTSQATPLVAGTGALLYARLKATGRLTGSAADAAKVKAALMATVDPIAGYVGKCASRGRLHAGKALRLGL